MKTHRNPAVAGMFYSSDPQKLAGDVEAYLSSSLKKSKEKVKFIIAPHAGYIYSGRIAGESFAEVAGQGYQKVIMLGPSHRYYFNGLAESDDAYWNLPTGEVKIRKIDDNRVEKNSDYHVNEHCLEVLLPFLKQLLPDADYSPILLSGHHKSAQQYAEVLMSHDDDETLWVISSDFNHVGPNFQHYPEHHGFSSGESMDLQAIDYITSGSIIDFSRFLEKTDATICGALPILVAMHLIQKMGRRTFEFKNYDCSGKQTGDVNSVGYAALFS